MKKTILLGYGNPDRGDDGVAWHLLNELLREHGKDIDLFESDVFPLTDQVDIWFNLQLLPEISETIAKYERVIFIDAHTGEIKEDINLQPVEPHYLSSPFTHHITPSTVLSLADALADQCLESWLLSIRGFEFKFERSLTKKTKTLARKALKILEERFLQ